MDAFPAVVKHGAEWDVQPTANSNLSDDSDEEEDDDDSDGDVGTDDEENNSEGAGGKDMLDEMHSVDPGLSRTKRSANGGAGTSRTVRRCWPPPQPTSSLPRAPVWTPLLRVNPTLAPGTSPPALPNLAPAPAPRPSGAPAPNPVYGHRMKLFCRTGYHLTIGPKGRVTGSSNRNDKYAVLEFSSVSKGEVRIRGVEANLFLAMNREGKLYGQANVRQEGTVFVEMLLGRYNTYLSRKFAHAGWYVGIKKNGKQKPGPKTAWGQKAMQFLPVRVL